MIPSQFEYAAPATLNEAVALLAKDPDAKALAGGHSLLPVMKLRLASPSVLVDLRNVAELRGVSANGGGWRIGAMTTHAQIAGNASLKGYQALIDATSIIGDVQVRNRGTVGGAIAHADPAADVPAVSLALDYSAVLRSPRGERVVPLDGFFTGPFMTTAEPDEILVAMRRGPLPDGAGGAYEKLAQPASGYAMVGVAVVVARSGGSISHARVGITGVGEFPYRAKAVESALVGSDGSASAIAAAAAHATDGVTVNSDIHANAAYRSAMAVVHTRRAIETALGRSA